MSRSVLSGLKPRGKDGGFRPMMLECSRKIVRNYIRGSSRVLVECESVLGSSSELSSVFTRVVQVTSTKENKGVSEEDSS